MMFGLALLLVSLAVPGRTLAVPPSPPGWATTHVVGHTAGQVAVATACGVFEQVEGGYRWSRVHGDVNNTLDLEWLAGGALLAITVPDSGDPVFYRRSPSAGWERVPQPFGRPHAIAVNRPGTVAYTVAGHDPMRLWRSTDAGITWQELGRLPDRADSILDMAVAQDPAGGRDVLFIASHIDYNVDASPRGKDLFRSVDGGATWSAVGGYAGAHKEEWRTRLFVDHSGTMVYVSGTGRTALSRVSATGAALEDVALPDRLRGAPAGVTALAAYDSTVIVASYTDSDPWGIFISTQRGAAGSYTPYEQGGLFNVNDLLFAPGPAGPTLYAATRDGIWQRNPTVGQWTPQLNRSIGCNIPPAGGPNPAPYAPVPAVPSTPQRAYFAETQHTLGGEFKEFWERNGGLPVFGYPLSEEFDEHNIDLNRQHVTQYLERERFEFHPENNAPYRVQLGRLGDELLKGTGRDWRTEDALDNPFGGTRCQSFDVGGEQRQVCGPFLAYWRGHGVDLDGQTGITEPESTALFGLPLTGVRMETNPDGAVVLTQWFERARFEWHPDNPEPSRVLLGRLGAEIVRLKTGS